MVTQTAMKKCFKLKGYKLQFDGRVNAFLDRYTATDDEGNTCFLATHVVDLAYLMGVEHNMEE